MVQSSVKFDDLAFILLFFFLMVAIVSFASEQTQTVETETETSSETEVVYERVFLDDNLNFVYEEAIVDLGFLQSFDTISLKCSESLSWKEICKSLKVLDDAGIEVVLQI